MFVGHATLAFGLAALAASAAGWSRERALAAGVVAGLFATVPDLDMAYAVVGPARSLGGDVWTLTEAFWASSTVVHRSVTHSLVVAVPAAAGFALWSRGRAARAGATALLAGVVATAAVVDGPLAAAVMAVFAVAGVGVGLAADRMDFDAPTVAALALVGLASHPFGDVFTGTPPAFLYPLDVPVLAARVAPFTDPTLNLLLAFAAELAAVWLGVAAFATVADVDLAGRVSPRAALGAGFVLAAPALQPPTVHTSYRFVFSVLAVGAVGATPWREAVARRLPDPVTAVVTGLAAVTLAVTAYAVAYVVGM